MLTDKILQKEKHKQVVENGIMLAREGARRKQQELKSPGMEAYGFQD